MRLRQPTDFLILEALADHGRNVAPNLESHTGKRRQNINVRLPMLADYGLVRKIGPAERSGLYELTPLGKAALAHREQYGEIDDFAARIRGPDPEASDADTTAAFVRGEDEVDTDMSP